MGYNGGSTLMKGSWMGRSEDEFTLTAKSLFGEDGFRDASEFHRYCDLIDRMKAFASNWPSVADSRSRIERLVIDAMVDAGEIELGKSSALVRMIKEVRGWPSVFVEALANNALTERDYQPAGYSR